MKTSSSPDSSRSQDYMAKIIDSLQGVYHVDTMADVEPLGFLCLLRYTSIFTCTAE